MEQVTVDIILMGIRPENSAPTSSKRYPMHSPAIFAYTAGDIFMKTELVLQYHHISYCISMSNQHLTSH